MTEPRGPTDKPADASAATPPGGAVLGSGRLRVTQRDLDLYAALVGVPQTLLIPDDPTAQVDESASATARAWQSLSHSVGGLTVRLGHSELSSWVRRVSGRAKWQLRQARLRLARPKGAPRPVDKA
jgi:hypothetical protein